MLDNLETIKERVRLLEVLSRTPICGCENELKSALKDIAHEAQFIAKLATGISDYVNEMAIKLGSVVYDSSAF